MSLLLDALKKAADEKKRSVNKTLDQHKEATNHTLQDETETLENEPVVDESLELELSIDTQQPESTRNNQREFQLVDESSVNHTTADNSDLTDNIQTSESTVLADKDVATSKIDPSPKNIVASKKDKLVESDESDAEKKHNEPSIDKLHSQADSSSVAEDISSEPVQPPADLSLQSTTTAKHEYKKSIESEKALSALIDRSNQYNNKQNLKTRISLAILFFLILIGSVLYFYIKINTTTQELYITQSSAPANNSAVNNTATKPEPVNQTLHNESETADGPSPASLSTNIKRTTKQLTPAQHAKPVTTKTTTTNRSVSNKTAQLKQTQEINIVHTKKSDPIHKLLQDAYAAFNKADYQTAETLYQQVIQRENRNRDAILGLSAIAIKQQRYEYARQKYQYLLHLNPKDSIATAGISLIKNSLNPQLSESQLKFMLKEQPDAAHLYFALGSLYSSQHQWAEAQGAFFSAWSTENKNADYAYNLAVSLDHLAKNLQALNYYQLSLKLAQTENINFSIENTQQRIHFLQQAQP